MRASSRAAGLLAAVVLAGGVAGCGPKGTSTGQVAGRPGADIAARLLAFVPADASFVFVRDQHASASDRFGNADSIADGLRSLRGLLAVEDGPAAAFGSALVDALVEEGATAAGWQEGRSAMVVYGLGFDTIVRASLDGKRLRATLDRAAATSGYRLATADWRGRPYYRVELPTPAFSIWFLLHIDDDGAAAAFTGEPDRLVELMMADRPTAPSYDVRAVAAAAYPGRDGARFAGAVDPARLGAALAATASRRPGWLAPVEGCVEQVIELLGATPSTRLAWIPGDDRLDVTALVDVAPATAERLGREVRPIPRWRDDDRGIRFGVGVGPRVLLDVVQPWMGAVSAASTACGGESVDLAMLGPLLPPAVSLIDSAVIEADPLGNTVTAALGARDPQALWASIRDLVPVRAQPPAPGEQVSFGPTAFLGGDDALGVSFGDGAASALPSLMAAPRGPREVLAFAIGRAALDKLREDDRELDLDFGSLAFHVAVRDRALAVEMQATARAKPAIAR